MIVATMTSLCLEDTIDAALNLVNALRLLTHVGFFRQTGLILSEVFCIWKGARILKQRYITVQKNSPS